MHLFHHILDTFVLLCIFNSNCTSFLFPATKFNRNCQCIIAKRQNAATNLFVSENKSIQKYTDHTCISPQNEVQVQVFDNVFSSYVCEELHYESEEHSTRGNDGSSVFTRPPDNIKPLTPIENAIHSFLSTLGDKTQKVEYWSRDEYINIDAHADIDEVELEDENTIRCPEMGHVLYLVVKKGLKAPTCVFPTKLSGWGTNDNMDNNILLSSNVKLVTVPAIQGRVLRFPGSAMHSVPRPAHRCLLSEEEDRLLQEEEERDENDFFDDEDDYEDENEEVERSVLLFNTWPDDEPGPTGVGGDYASGALPDGIELNEEDTLSFLQSEESWRLSQWEEEYGVNATKIHCNPQDQWKAIEVLEEAIAGDDEDFNTESIRVRLMGDKKRRLFSQKFGHLLGSSKILKKALTEERMPTLIQLKTKIKPRV